jgi:hypothetical protein
MAEDTPLRISHDVSQALQRKVEGLGDVERAFVHVDYEHEHDIHEEHKPLYERKDKKKPSRSLKDILLRTKKETQPQTTTTEETAQGQTQGQTQVQTQDKTE